MPSGNPAEARDPLHEEAKRIFADALEQPPDKRAEYLDRVCGANVDLHREVMSLLENHEGASFLEQPPVITRLEGNAVLERSFRTALERYPASLSDDRRFLVLRSCRRSCRATPRRN